MGLLVAKAQVLICKELNVACFISSSIFAHETLLVFICARFFQHDSVLVLHLGQQMSRGRELHLVQLERKILKMLQYNGMPNAGRL